MNDPTAFDTEVARQTGANREMVARVRSEMVLDSAASSTIEGRNKPINRAKQAFIENPKASLSEVAKLAKVSEDTAVRARRQLAAEPPPTREEPKRECRDMQSKSRPKGFNDLPAETELESRGC